MTALAFCIGSNIDPEANIRRALAALRERFGPLRCSHVYRSAAAGFDGPDFLNLAALAEADEPLAGIVQWIKRLELRLGRDPNKPRFASRPIDIDLFVPGEAGDLTVSRREIEENAFVLRPLAELLPSHKLAPGAPGLAELWARHDKSRHPLEPVALHFKDYGPIAPTGTTATPSGRRNPNSQSTPKHIAMQER